MSEESKAAEWPDTWTEADDRQYYLHDDEIELFERYRALSADGKALVLEVAARGEAYVRALIATFPAP